MTDKQPLKLEGAEDSYAIRILELTEKDSGITDAEVNPRPPSAALSHVTVDDSDAEEALDAFQVKYPQAVAAFEKLAKHQSISRLDSGLTKDPYYTYTSNRSGKSQGSRRALRDLFDRETSTRSRRRSDRKLHDAAFLAEYSESDKDTRDKDSPREEYQSAVESAIMELEKEDAHGSGSSVLLLLVRSVAALGVIYGDIGTSVLYTFTAIFSPEVKKDSSGQISIDLDEDAIIGALSNIIWTLIFVVCIKYCGFVLRADYNMEGGTFALYQRVMAQKERLSKRAQTTLLVLTCCGASLLMGESAITPAISILSALEGIELQEESFTGTYVVVTAIAILVVLFGIQFMGTDKVGRVFGPAMLVWFLSIGTIGIYNLALSANPGKVLTAFSPWVALKWWISGPFAGRKAWVTMASVVLTVTGTEAMFADLGHFGRNPIYASWFIVVFPCLILQYIGQTAFLIDFIPDPSITMERKEFVITKSVFWGSIPGSNPGSLGVVYILMLIIATLATIVASQALITGAFTLMSQASALEILPRLNVVHTSKNQKGQVYIGVINFTLAILCILLVIIFQTSSNLAAAYGCAVTSVFFITTIILSFYVAPICWNFHWSICTTMFLILGTIDGIFMSSNYLKVPDGGWFPLTLAFLIVTTMGTWKSGKLMSAKAYIKERNEAITMGSDRNKLELYTVNEIKQAIKTQVIGRSAGLAVFLTPEMGEIPVSMARLVARLGVIPKYVILLTVRIVNIPFVPPTLRSEVFVMDSGLNIYSVVIFYGWAEPLSELNITQFLRDAAHNHNVSLPFTPDLKALLQQLTLVKEDSAVKCDTSEEPVSYFVNNNHLRATRDRSIFVRFVIGWFGMLKRLFGTSTMTFFNLPPTNTTEVGTVLFAS